MYRIKNSTELANLIEYNNLNNLATTEEMEEFLQKAKEFEFYGVLINPTYIKLAKDILKDTNAKIGTVIGYPLGFDTIDAKIELAKLYINAGADEISMVNNISHVKNEQYPKIENEISEVKKAIGDKILKVVIETKALEDIEKANVSKAIEKGGADYIVTSTGFVSPSTIYENVNDINIIQKYAPKTKITVSGGITQYKLANQILTAGADIISSTEGYGIVKDYRNLRENTQVTPKPIKFD